jgi:hypothetical protein
MAGFCLRFLSVFRPDHEPVTGKLLFQTRHSHQDEPEPVSVIKIAQMFKRCDAEPVRLVHDQQGARGLCLGGGFGISCHACQGQTGMPEAEQIELQPVIDDLGRVGNRRGEEESTAAFDGARDIRTDRLDRDVAGQIRAGRVVAAERVLPTPGRP